MGKRRGENERSTKGRKKRSSGVKKGGRDKNGGKSNRGASFSLPPLKNRTSCYRGATLVCFVFSSSSLRLWRPFSFGSRCHNCRSCLKESMATFTDDVWQKQWSSISSIRGRQEQSGWEGRRRGKGGPGSGGWPAMIGTDGESHRMKICSLCPFQEFV